MSEQTSADPVVVRSGRYEDGVGRYIKDLPVE